MQVTASCFPVRQPSKQASLPPINEKVLAHAVSTLKKDPETGSNALFESAQSIDPAIRKLDRRVFHMRYAMRARRIIKAEERGATGGTATKSRAPKREKVERESPRKTARKVPAAQSNRARSTIQAILNDTMKEALQAESKEEILALFNSMESRTDRLLELVGNR